MVIGPLSALPVIPNHGHVQIPALHLGFSFVHDFHSRRAKRHRRKPGRRADAFLRATIDRVDPPIIDTHVNTSQRGNRIHQQQRARGVGDFAYLFQRLADACGCLGVDDCNQLWIAFFEGFFHGRWIYGLTPWRIDADKLSAASLDDIAHAIAEHSVDAHKRLIARLEQVHEARFHPSAACSRDGESQLVFRAEQLTQHILYLVHHDDELRVEVPDDRRHHSLQYPRMDVAGAWPHQKTCCRVKFARYCHNLLLLVNRVTKYLQNILNVL